ncbi:MAG TPA: methyltransferase domain-containing protein [Actinospica sp.]|nr:methyltransferase domain-containing protein [Actinospica sp.]
MKLAERLHGTHQHGQGHAHAASPHGNADTEGITIEHGRRYDAFVDTFFLGRRSAVYSRLAELSGARPGDRVLDVGCGTGYLTQRLAAIAAPADGSSRADRRASVVGVDASLGMLEQARRSAGGPGSRRTGGQTDSTACEFVLGAAERLEFEDGSFDVVASSLMLHHLPQDLRARALAEMRRVLRPGGRLLVAEFRPPSTRLGRHLIASVTGPAMQEDMRSVLPGLIREAGFIDVRTGDLRPWITYAHAVTN